MASAKLGNFVGSSGQIKDGIVTPVKLSVAPPAFSGFNNTEASRKNAGNLQSITLTDAQANYDYLLLIYSGRVQAQSQNITVLKAYNGAGEIGAELTLVTGSTGVELTDNYCYACVLVAGADYTKGTGFTLSGRVKSTSSSPFGIYSNMMVVLGA